MSLLSRLAGNGARLAGNGTRLAGNATVKAAANAAKKAINSNGVNKLHNIICDKTPPPPLTLNYIKQLQKSYNDLPNTNQRRNNHTQSGSDTSSNQKKPLDIDIDLVAKFLGINREELIKKASKEEKQNDLTGLKPYAKLRGWTKFDITNEAANAIKAATAAAKEAAAAGKPIELYKEQISTIKKNRDNLLLNK